MLKIKDNVDLKTLVMNSKYEIKKGINIDNYDEYPIIIWVEYDLEIKCSDWVSCNNYYTTLSGFYELMKDNYIEKVEE